MNKFLIPILLVVLFFSVSCGEAPPQSTEIKVKKARGDDPKKTETVTEKKDEAEDVVDPDAFSKAFSHDMKKPDDTDKKEFVEDPTEFFKEGDIVKNRFTNQEFKENRIPHGTIASQVFSSKKYSWLPNWNYSGKGGVTLPDAAISSDRTLLSILDNVSSGKGVNSSLIVSLNTSNFNIQTIHYYKGKLLTGIKYLPRSKEVVVWEESQEERGKGRFHLVDLKSGKILNSSEMLKSSNVEFEIRGNGKELIAKIAAKTNRMFIFKIDALNELPEVVECDQKEGTLAVSPDNTLFALAGKEKIEIFKFSDRMKLKEVKISLEQIPDDFIFVDGNNSFALLSYMKPLYFVSNGSSKELCDLSGRKLFFRKDNNSIVFEESMHKAVSIINLESLLKVDTFSPSKLRPRTLGSALLITYLPHLEKYMVLDNQGNLSIFYRPGKRWRKRLIFTPEK